MTALIQHFIIKKQTAWEPSEAMLEKVKGVRRTYNKQHVLSIRRFISMSHYQPTNLNISELQSHYLLIFWLRGLEMTLVRVSRWSLVHFLKH